MSRRPLFTLFILLVLIFSCHEGRPRGESLKQSWERYWTYRVQGELRKAFFYEYLSITGDIKPQEYAQKVGGSFIIKDFEFLGIGKQGSGPKGSTPVNMKLVTSWPKNLPFRVKFKGDRVLNFKDYWIKEKGYWYRLRI